MQSTRTIPFNFFRVSHFSSPSLRSPTFLSLQMANASDTTILQWFTTICLIFVGCCANAYFLEQATRLQPSCGTLLTFLQFLVTTIQTFPTQLQFSKSHGIRFKGPSIPLKRWSVQVALYFGTSILNNTAFSFHVPVPVHIIFRSGGLVVNMVLTYLIRGKKYTRLQIISVVLVTGGVIASTLATTPSKSSSSSSSSNDDGPSTLTYFMGILLLLAALVLSSLMGLYQEGTFAIYGSEHWQEGLFYNHFLSLPLFALRYGTLSDEWHMANRGNRMWIGWGAPGLTDHIRALSWGLQGHKEQARGFSTLTSSHEVWDARALFYQAMNWKTASLTASSLGLLVPVVFPSLILNVLTQLLCINGVNRLTSICSSLTVTLVLVIRKAISLAISVLILAPARGEEMQGKWLLGAGATSVLLGTIGYAISSSPPPTATDKKIQGEEKEPAEVITKGSGTARKQNQSVAKRK
jgi:UDP-xylose/UDP-N-acetylglucosamine transporter B4